MTTETTSTPTPKKSYKGLIWTIIIVILAWTTDRYTTNYVSGGAEVTADSTNVVPSVDTIIPIPAVVTVADTTKADTVKVK